jgi:tetratricopeptide (TPR) repeat protein
MHREIRLLFHELLDLSPAERERVFAERGIGENVRAEVASLLSFDSQPSGLTGCVSETAGEMLAAGEPAVCGPYRLVRMLGAGGMGTVYLAERSDGEIQRRVAIKLLGGGGGRPEWRGRFLRERQLLASLNHASIVHLLDAGHTQDGRPYLVMEYVEGILIDTYAECIDVRARLELFLRVCDGVSHAHRRLIIHRDLKPSNILVDASGQPKLLDFGIAKLLDESPDATQTVERLLTPGYASPEQLSGMAQTTATDVYSLGAVLYKLLTGQPPHETEGGTARTLDIITGAHVIPAPTRLNPALPGDLDYVLRKALRTEPEARYASVDAFAADLRAVLDRRPVSARSGDAWYRARRFLRRYWVPTAAAAATVAALSVGLYATNRERAIAQRRFVEVRQLANRLFDIDVAVRRENGVTKARKVIVATSLEYLRRLSAEVHGDPDLALDLGTAYMRVARVQGVPIAPDLGQTEEAERSLRAAGKLIEGVLAAQPENRVAILRMAQIHHDRMILAAIRGSQGEALRLARVSQMWLERYLGSGTVDPSEAEQVTIVINNVANHYRRSGLYSEAASLCHRGVVIARSANLPNQAGAMFLTTAAIYRDQGDLDHALTDIRQAVQELKPAPGEAGVGRIFTYALALIREGEVLGQDEGISLGRTAEAQVPLQQAFDLLEGIVHKDPANSSSRTRLATAGVDLGDLLRHTDPKRAVAIFDETLLHLGEVKNNVDARRNEIDALTDSTYPLRRLGRTAEARRRLDAAFARLRQLHLYPAERIELGERADLALRARADLDAGTGNVARASAIYQELLQQVLAGGPKPETDLADAVDLSNLYRAAAEVQRRAGRPGLASSLAARRAGLWREWSARLPQNEFVRRQLDAALRPASNSSANSSLQFRFPN